MMRKWGEMPNWMNRVANSLCSVLAGTAIGAALLHRPNSAEQLALVASGLASIYLLCWLFLGIRWLVGTSRNGAA